MSQRGSKTKRRGEPGRSRERKARTRSTRRVRRRKAVEEQKPKPIVKCDDANGFPLQSGQRVRVSRRPHAPSLGICHLNETRPLPGFSGCVEEVREGGVIIILEFDTWSFRVAESKYVRVQRDRLGTAAACRFFLRRAKDLRERVEIESRLQQHLYNRKSKAIDGLFGGEEETE